MFLETLQWLVMQEKHFGWSYMQEKLETETVKYAVEPQ